jgi:acetylornithine deacetylase/succinyl-diaminopimelate desuccinylase-like protein
MRENLNRVFGQIRDDALVKLTRDLIRIPSPNFGEAAVADFLAERMRGIGMDVQMMTVEHPTEKGKSTRQAIGRLRGTGGGPTLMFNGHTDVNVMMSGWTVDPHEGKFEDGMIWGLGAQDDKGGLGAALVAIEAIARSRIELKGDLLYCPVATHKLGGTGTRVMLKNGVRADYCINIEHSANTVGSVIVGSVRVKLRTTTPGLFFRFTEEARADYLNSIEQQALCLEAFGPSLTPVREGGWLRFKRHPQLEDFPMIRHDAIHKDHYGRWCDLIFQVRTVPGMTLESVREDVEKVLRAIKARHPKFDCQATIPANGPDDPFFMEPTDLPDSVTWYSVCGYCTAASAVMRGMSPVQCLPGPRKKGQTITRVAPRATQRAYAVAIDGSASSMCAGSTISYVSRNRSPNRRATSSSIALLSSRREPWSTITMPLLRAVPAPLSDAGRPLPIVETIASIPSAPRASLRVPCPCRRDAASL